MGHTLYNVQALESEEVQQAFRNKILELRGSAPVEGDQRGIDEQWSVCETVIKDAADDVIGMQEPPQRNEWSDAERAAATWLKNEALKICWLIRIHDGRGRSNKGGDMKKRNYIGEKKREVWKGMMEEIEELGIKNETRKFYRKVNAIKKGYKPRTGMCKDKMGNSCD